MNLVEDYEQFKINKEFIELNNFEEKTKELVFKVLEDGEKNRKLDEKSEIKENIEYFTTEEILEELSTNNLNTLSLIKENKELIKNIDEDLKEVLLLLINDFHLNNSAIVINLGFEIFGKKGNYKELIKYFEGYNLKLNEIIEKLIYFHKKIVGESHKIKDNDLEFLGNIVKNESVYGKIEKEGNDNYLVINNISIDGLKNDNVLNFILSFYNNNKDNNEELNNGNEKIKSMLNNLKNADNMLEGHRKALDKLLEYSNINEVKKYLFFLGTKGNEMHGNYLWTYFLGEYSDAILKSNINNIGEIIKKLMAQNISLEKDAKG